MSESRKIHKRGLTSFFTLFGFLIMSITGLILYIVPEGRVAYWTNWYFGGLSKVEWGNIHIISSLLFIAAGIFHIAFNWKPLINYFRDRVTKGLKLGRELVITTVISIILVVFSIYSIPPVSYLLDLNSFIKSTWIISQEYEPPYGHAEESSLKVLTTKMDIPLSEAVQELRANGIQFESTDMSMLEIAEANNMSPMKLYSYIKKLEPKITVDEQIGWTPESVELEFAGTGLGNRTIAVIAEKLQVDYASAKATLKAKGIEFGDDETIKDIAAKYDVNPIDIVKALLLDNYRIGQ